MYIAYKGKVTNVGWNKKGESNNEGKFWDRNSLSNSPEIPQI